MPRNGRPKLEEPQIKKISLRVSEKDYERILAYAEKHKITVDFGVIEFYDDME